MGGVNRMGPADKLFADYCHALGYETEWEPYPPHPHVVDFRVRTAAGAEVAVEVKALEGPGALNKKLDTSGQGFVKAEQHETLRPLRDAITAAARQLKGLRDLGIPLVVALVPSPRCGTPTDAHFVIAAMFGDLQLTFETDPSGHNSTWGTGRNGRLTPGTHAYLSAVLVLHTTAPDDPVWVDEWWQDHEKRDADRGLITTRADVFEAASPTAIRLPADAFTGTNDARWAPDETGANLVRVR